MPLGGWIESILQAKITIFVFQNKLVLVEVFYDRR